MDRDGGAVTMGFYVWVGGWLDGEGGRADEDGDGEMGLGEWLGEEGKKFQGVIGLRGRDEAGIEEAGSNDISTQGRVEETKRRV